MLDKQRSLMIECLKLDDEITKSKIKIAEYELEIRTETGKVIRKKKAFESAEKKLKDFLKENNEKNI